MIVILISITSKNLFAQLSIIYPKNNQCFSNIDSVNFTLHSNEILNKEIQFSEQLDFSTIAFDTIINNSSFTRRFIDFDGDYYCRAKNVSDINWSPLIEFSIINIHNISMLWLRSDSADVDNGKVVGWLDRSSGANNAIQTNVDFQPTYNIQNDIIQHPTIELDGINDYLTGNSINNINASSFSLYIIHSGNNQNGTIVSGIFGINQISNGINLFRRFYQNSNHLSYVSENQGILSPFGIYPEEGYPFHLITLDKTLNSSTELYVNSEVVAQSNNSVLNSSFTNNSYTIGKTNQNLHGDFAEILIIQESPQEVRDKTSRYLMDRYAPPVNLGPDLTLEYGFCDTIISATEDHFISYLWSTGDTTSVTSINEPGIYWLDATDIFNRTLRDTIVLYRPVYDSINIGLEFICPGIDTDIEAYIPSGEYNFISWNNGNSNSIITISSPSNISYSVSDSSGCSLFSNIAAIAIDNSIEEISLGIDTSLCVGNSIQLEQSSSTITDYLWNTGVIMENQVVDTSGSYILDVINENGCENSDTIIITIIGDAPTLSYTIPSEICQGSEFNYSESSTVPPGNNISSLIWDFGDSDSSGISSGSHYYVDSGVFNASLEVYTLEGCKSKDEFIITVYPKPIVSFETENYCPYEEIDFTPSNSYTVPLDSYNWDLGQGVATSANSNPTHIYNTSGNYDVELIAIDTNNCSDTVVQNVFIQPAPLADISILNPCELSALEITDNSSISDTFSIVTYSWDYGDNTSAVTPAEDKFYELYGDYTIQLALTANNGCVDSIEQSITVHPNPIIDYSVGPACMNTWTSLENTSTIPIGSLTETNWLINLQYTDIQTNTFFNFPTKGIQLIVLQSISDQGCMVDTTFNIDVQEEINADFNVTPIDITSGTPIQFTNESIGSDSSYWDFGDGNGLQYNQNEINEIIYDNTLNGSSIDVSLIISNNIGCRDTSMFSYEIKEAFFDLALQTLFAQDIDGYLTVGVELKNLGSIVVESTELYLKTTENSSILENWSGALAQNESAIYIFSSHPPSFNSSVDEIERSVCVEGVGMNTLGYIDVDFSNNKVCKNIEGSGMILLPIYPNPTEEDITISILLTESSPLRIELVDQSGRLVLDQNDIESLEAGIHNFQLPFSRLQKGIYHVRVSDNSTTLLEKIIRY